MYTTKGVCLNIVDDVQKWKRMNPGQNLYNSRDCYGGPAWRDMVHKKF